MTSALTTVAAVVTTALPVAGIVGYFAYIEGLNRGRERRDHLREKVFETRKELEMIKKSKATQLQDPGWSPEEQKQFAAGVEHLYQYELRVNPPPPAPPGACQLIGRDFYKSGDVYKDSTVKEIRGMIMGLGQHPYTFN